LLFSDIVDSTRLLRNLGSLAYADALGEHRRILREVFSAHGGREVGTSGDSFFVVFSSAEMALAASIAAHKALRGGPIRVRIGMETGQPSLVDGDYVGEVVHAAARIGSLAHAGQVLLGAATAAALPESITVKNLGRHHLKGFADPVPVFQAGRDPFPPLSTRGAVDLPRQATAFLGRESAMFDALQLLEARDPPVLTVLGPGGTGKTRFMIELARRLADQAEGGTYYVPLAGLWDADLLLAAVARSVGVGERGDDAVEDIAAAIGDRRTTLLSTTSSISCRWLHRWCLGYAPHARRCGLL
jgi:hypothetical protein